VIPNLPEKSQDISVFALALDKMSVNTIPDLFVVPMLHSRVVQSRHRVLDLSSLLTSVELPVTLCSNRICCLSNPNGFVSFSSPRHIQSGSFMFILANDPTLAVYHVPIIPLTKLCLPTFNVQVRGWRRSSRRDIGITPEGNVVTVIVGGLPGLAIQLQGTTIKL
jgi:hypothetical protein